MARPKKEEIKDDVYDNSGDQASHFLKLIENEYAAIAEDGIQAADVSGFIDTGSYSLNALLSGSIYGGLPSNKITGFAGSSGVGKTFYVLQFIKEFLNTKKKGLVFLFESESAITKKMLQDRGIDVKRTVIIPVETVEEFRTQALKIINNYLKQKEEDRIPLFFALDSLGNLSTSKEMEDIATGNNKRDMTRAQLLRGAFRTLTLKLGKANVPLICTNHVYGVIGAYVPTNKQGGGEGLIYAASSIIELTKSKDREDDGSISGAIIKASLTKGRITIENKKVETLLNYKTGLDRYYGLLPLAEKFGIFKKVSTRYEVADGVTAFENKILSEPERYFTKDVLDKIDEKCKEEFLYGVPDVVTAIDGDNIDD